jgi:peptide/nickel transport system permease protein
MLPDGRQIRDYPRLEYGGAHLNDPEIERGYDIVQTIIRASLEALAIWTLAAGLSITLLACHWHMRWREGLKAVVGGRTELPWQVILGTAGILIGLAVVATHLSSHYHILGTDKVGQDVFYQSLKSIRTGLVIGTLTTLVMLPFAILLGIMAGYFGGRIDDGIQYLYTTLNSIPGVLLIAAAILMTQVYMATHAASFESLEARADMRLLFLCMILGVTSWTGLCRLLRGETLKLREVDYIQAAYAFGVGNLTIIVRHILPNVMHIVLIAVVLDFSSLVLAEAVLSYINIGVDPSMISWGNMINGARLEMAREPIVWWSLVAAFIFMFGLVLSANLFSDAVRDGFDPRLRVR